MPDESMYGGMGGMYGYGGMMGQMMQDPALIGAQMRQQYAMALMNQGMSTEPVRSPWQALARGVQGGLGGYEMQQGLGQMQAVSQQQQQELDAQQQRDAAMLYGMGHGTLGGQPPVAGAPPAPVAQGPGTAPVQPKAEPANLTPIIDQAAAVTKIPRNIISGMVMNESAGDPNAVSKTGAQGLMQILPSTAANPGYGMQGISADDLKDPTKNIMFGAQYLDARGRAEFGDKWDPNDPTMMRVALQKYSGNAQYAQTLTGGASGGPPTVGGQPVTFQGQVVSQAVPPEAQVDGTGMGAGRQQWAYWSMQAANARTSYNPRLRAMAPFYQDMATQALNFGAYGPVHEIAPGVLGQTNQNTGKTETTTVRSPEQSAYYDLAAANAYVKAGKPVPPDIASRYALDWQMLGYGGKPTFDPERGVVITVPQNAPPAGFLPPEQMTTYRPGVATPAAAPTAAPSAPTAAPPPAGGPGGAPGAAPSAPAGPAAAPTPTATAGPSGVTVQPVPGVATTPQIEAGGRQIDADRTLADGMRVAGNEGDQTIALTQQIRSLIDSGKVPTGLLNPLRLGLAQILSASGEAPATIAKITGMDPTYGQLLNKLMLQFSTQKTREMGAREPGSVIQLFQTKYPSPESTPQTIDAFLRETEMQVRYDQRKSELMQQWLDENRGQPASYQSINSPQFNKWAIQQGLDPRVYAAAGEAAAKMPHSVWGDGLTTDAQTNAAIALARKEYGPIGILRPPKGNPNGPEQWYYPKPAAQPGT